MPATAISEYLYLLDDAFNGTEWHSLLGNLQSVTFEDWEWRPAGGHRTIQAIVQHVGGTKLMYDNHAFGDATLTWNDPRVTGEGRLATIPQAIAWLRDCHEQLRRSVTLLSDDDLPLLRMTNWGEPRETRWIITIMIQHDHYHAGEINHIRALHQRNDRWAYDTGDEAA
jgi:hypothetical protein